MKITFFCQECCNISSKEGGVTSEKGGRGAWKVNAMHMPIQNKYLYEFECEQMGHKNNILLDNLNYEVIFDSGLSALQDGYYAEAVSTIYASLEYFYKEMTIYMYHLINKELSLEGLNQLFSKINNLSEKQVGMFHGIYFALMGETCKVFDPKFIGKRNKVIHGSLYPSYLYAIELADYIKNYIWEIYNNIEAKFPNTCFDLYKSQLIYTGEAEHYNQSLSRQSYSYILSSNYKLNNINYLTESVKNYNPFWQIMKTH